MAKSNTLNVANIAKSNFQDIAPVVTKSKHLDIAVLAAKLNRLDIATLETKSNCLDIAALVAKSNSLDVVPLAKSNRLDIMAQPSYGRQVRISRHCGSGKSRWVDLAAAAKKSRRVDRPLERRCLDGLTWMPKPSSLDGLTWMPEPRSLDVST